MLGSYVYDFLSSADFFFFFFYLFSKKSFRNTIIVSNSLDPDQPGHFVGPLSGSKLFANIIRRRNRLILLLYSF